ncbi:HpcH/HpaI aldolase/citrate lyase family protein [Tranquillimonas alkanivorans]|uniref:Citrate lyase subunit beta / citryl-CoA lyase n=1 Tax=Tranquillimonas alkanivorans TaxID=441119 RepID=A0A1I5TKP0_9RHOB|nr:CoA ester lyase [Tranquillimonas alkanivorans]SFP83639.1 citrate lyase subunit beta / citryl-CoA lyase [Tranquillimonas alkanivorans]
MRLRSLLYVPADRDRFVAKAHERGADAVILDLEDAVAEDAKDAARDALSEAVPCLRQRGARVLVRVNSGPRQGPDARAATRAGVEGIVLPKADGPAAVDELLAEIPGEDRMPVLAIVEDAAGMMDARAIAAHRAVVAVSLGAEDFATATGGQPTPEVLRLPKLLVHYAAKAEGKLSLGMLRSTVDFTDTEAIADAAAQAARFGFDGATCIHPKIVPVLNAAFAPSDAEIERARRIVAAAEDAAKSGRGAFMVDDEFVDLPVLNRAKLVLEKAGEAS